MLPLAPPDQHEAIAVNCALRLSHLLDELPAGAAATSAAGGSRAGAAQAIVGMGGVEGMGDEEAPRMVVLRTIRRLRPKIVTVVEQQSNVGSPFFLTRFYEALFYYSTLFESLDRSLPKNEVARRMFEEQVGAGLISKQEVGSTLMFSEQVGVELMFTKDEAGGYFAMHAESEWT